MKKLCCTSVQCSERILWTTADAQHTATNTKYFYTSCDYLTQHEELNISNEFFVMSDTQKIIGNLFVENKRCYIKQFHIKVFSLVCSLQKDFLM